MCNNFSELNNANNFENGNCGNQEQNFQGCRNEFNNNQEQNFQGVNGGCGCRPIRPCCRPRPCFPRCCRPRRCCGGGWWGW